LLVRSVMLPCAPSTADALAVSALPGQPDPVMGSTPPGRSPPPCSRRPGQCRTIPRRSSAPPGPRSRQPQTIGPIHRPGAHLALAFTRGLRALTGVPSKERAFGLGRSTSPTESRSRWESDGSERCLSSGHSSRVSRDIVHILMIGVMSDQRRCLARRRSRNPGACIPRDLNPHVSEGGSTPYPHIAPYAPVPRLICSAPAILA
jgi:hypothetical protein